jgi:inosine/xanthosine triphosphatase
MALAGVRIAVGSTRGPKVEAVRRALALIRDRFPHFLGGEPELLSCAVSSGASLTPRSTEELMAGAEERARAAYAMVAAEGEPPALAVGLEGGLRVEAERAGRPLPVWLESWAYVTDGRQGSFGSGGCVPLPEPLARAVVERGEDLGPAADRFYGLADVAGGQGTFGVLTGRLITREDAFLRALLHALAPFYNPSAY